ncbi:MAG: alpha-amylase [Deltaproteobacteria bacterium]|nr:alpha-amylase [Deltaproteobacteria bacterium]
MSFVWWKHGVLYQIYPRSFMDSDGDGTGDLEGILSRLDYVADLGVSGIWLSPCFVSPMKDFGYDVADYKAIDPLFGSNDGFARLLDAAHQKGLKILLDFVPNHTSDQHRWFQNALIGKDAEFRDYYVFKDPAPDGGPPNNWKSVFGGSAWKYDDKSGQFFLHSYLDCQPDLDWRNPKVEEAMHDILRFWLDKGVDGFRIDVIHRIAKDPLFRDNPEQESDESYNGQTRVHDENHEDVHIFLRRLRSVMNEYDERALVGEIFLFSPKTVAAYYGAGDELHLAFNFSFTRALFSAESFANEVSGLLAAVPDEGWPCWVLSNHDLSRHHSRYATGNEDLDERRAKLLAMLLLFLPGTPFVYNGDELGMRDVVIPSECRQDPIWKTLGEAESRDPCRTPIRWNPHPPTFGFTDADSAWLPMVDDGKPPLSVEEQKNIPQSMLALYQEAIALRTKHPVLHLGRLKKLTHDGNVLSIEVVHEEVVALGLFYFGDDAKELPKEYSFLQEQIPILASSFIDEKSHRGTLGKTLGGVSAFWFLQK